MPSSTQAHPTTVDSLPLPAFDDETTDRLDRVAAPKGPRILSSGPSAALLKETAVEGPQSATSSDTDGAED